MVVWYVSSILHAIARLVGSESSNTHICPSNIIINPQILMETTSSFRIKTLSVRQRLLEERYDIQGAGFSKEAMTPESNDLV